MSCLSWAEAQLCPGYNLQILLTLVTAVWSAWVHQLLSQGSQDHAAPQDTTAPTTKVRGKLITMHIMSPFQVLVLIGNWYYFTSDMHYVHPRTDLRNSGGRIRSRSINLSFSWPFHYYLWFSLSNSVTPLPNSITRYRIPLFQGPFQGAILR